MKHIEEIFGGENAEEQNVLLHVIKERGYKFFEKTPKTTMTIRLLEDLHELGYEIQPKANNHVVLDDVIECVQFDADEIIAFLNDCETLDEAKVFADEHLR